MVLNTERTLVTPPGHRQPHRPEAAARPPERQAGVNVSARQFSGPSGPIGRLVTVLLARGNAGFNRWLVGELSAAVPVPAIIVELGCGPGIALQELLRSYPDPRVVDVAPSPLVLNNACRRHPRAVPAR